VGLSDFCKSWIPVDPASPALRDGPQDFTPVRTVPTASRGTQTMPPIDIKGSECGAIQMIDDAQLGTNLTCPKCRTTFLAEAGDDYGLADEDVEAPPQAAPRSRAPGKPARESRPAVETEAQRALRERMEKWAEDQ